MRSIKKTAEATGDLIGNKIADKITIGSKKSKKPQNIEANDEETPKERHIYVRKKITNYWWIKASIII